MGVRDSADVGRSGRDDDVGVRVRSLVKRYPKADVNAVDGISFDVEPGSVLGLLGPNGAGKSTTIGVLTTRVRPTSGQAMVAGVDVVVQPETARRALGVVPQRDNLELSLSVHQNLVYHGAYHGLAPAVRQQRADHLLEQFGLTDRAKALPTRLSGGQFRRVMIARALMHDPAVLFLDEPASGLDPAARLFVWQRIREMRAAGVTIVLTTHDMEEATALADRVGIMDHGRLLVLDRPDALIATLPAGSTLDVTVDIDDHAIPVLVDLLGDLDGVEHGERIDVTPAGHTFRLSLSASAPRLIAPVATTVERCGARVVGVDLGNPTLEDVFIQLTGRRLR